MRERESSARDADDPGPPPRAPRGVFELTVDEGGELLVAIQPELAIGHVRGAADLPFLADIAPIHARLARCDSLRAGPGWRIAPEGDLRVLVNGAPVDGAGVRLEPGDRIELAANLVFAYALPDAASHSGLLELVRGAECAGPQRVVLFGAGPGGRIKIGPARRSHVVVPRLAAEVVLEHADGRLVLACDEPLVVAGGAGATRLELACPPSARVAVEVGRRAPGEPPFLVVLAPAAGLR